MSFSGFVDDLRIAFWIFVGLAVICGLLANRTTNWLIRKYLFKQLDLMEELKRVARKNRGGTFNRTVLNKFVISVSSRDYAILRHPSFGVPTEWRLTEMMGGFLMGMGWNATPGPVQIGIEEDSDIKKGRCKITNVESAPMRKKAALVIPGVRTIELSGRPVVMRRPAHQEFLPGPGQIHLVDPAVDDPHAGIRCVDGVMVIEDFGSVNGTFVDGVRINGATELFDGAEIVVGQTLLQYYS